MRGLRQLSLDKKHSSIDADGLKEAGFQRRHLAPA